MSSSTSYRAVTLSPAERAELARQARSRKLAEELVPALVGRAQHHVELASSSGLITARQRHALIAHLEGASGLQEIRAVVGAIPSGSAPLSSASSAAPGPTTRRPAPSPRRLATSSLAGVPTRDRDRDRDRDRAPSTTSTMIAWKIAELETRLDLAIADAAALGLDLRDQPSRARTLLDASAVDAAVARGELATAGLRRAGRIIDLLDQQVDAALARAEERQATTRALSSILEQMGFTLDDVEPTSGQIDGHVADGRTVQLRLEESHAGTVLVTRTDDAGDAVPPGPPSASEPCTGAVSLASDIHDRIDRDPVLDAGAVTVRERPVRARPPTGATTRAANAARTQHNQKRSTR